MAEAEARGHVRECACAVQPCSVLLSLMFNVSGRRQRRYDISATAHIARRKERVAHAHRAREQRVRKLTLRLCDDVTATVRPRVVRSDGATKNDNRDRYVARQAPDLSVLHTY